MYREDEFVDFIADDGKECFIHRHYVSHIKYVSDELSRISSVCGGSVVVRGTVHEIRKKMFQPHSEVPL